MKLVFRKDRSGGLSGQYQGKPVYPHKDWKVKEDVFTLCEVQDRGRHFLAVPFQPTPEWVGLKKEQDALISQSPILFRKLRCAYSLALEKCPMPSRPIGNVISVVRYSGGQGWDGLHGDTAEDGGDYYTSDELVVTPLLYDAYVAKCQTWWEQLEITVGDNFIIAKDFLAKSDSLRDKIRVSGVPEDYLYFGNCPHWYADAMRWTQGSMYGPLDGDIGPCGPNIWYRDGLTITKEK